MNSISPAGTPLPPLTLWPDARNDHPAVTHSVIRQISSTDPDLDKSDKELLRAKCNAAQDSLKPHTVTFPLVSLLLSSNVGGLNSAPSHQDQTLPFHPLSVLLLTSCNPGRLSVVSIFNTRYQLTSVF